jgi:hypothetical protein
LIHLLLSLRFAGADQFILPVLMLLTGFSLLTLLSLQDPLRDRFLAKSTILYFGGGVIAVIILMLFNLRRFTTDSSLYRLFVLKEQPLCCKWMALGPGCLHPAGTYHLLRHRARRKRRESKPIGIPAE